MLCLDACPRCQVLTYLHVLFLPVQLSAALAGRKRLEVDEVLANARRSKHERYEYLLAMQVLPPSKTRLERAAERVHPRAWPFSDSIVEQGLAGKDELVAIGRAMEAHDAQAAAEAEAPEPQNALLAGEHAICVTAINSWTFVFGKLHLCKPCVHPCKERLLALLL